MAIYHCSIKIISRGKGKSAVASAAYRSGEILTNDYDGVTHDFTRKRGIVHTDILLPPHASPEFSDRSIRWNSVEKIEKARNSQLAREVEVALPVELDREKQIQLVRDYVTENFVSVGMCADIAIHDKSDGNLHAHIILTMRPLEESGEWGAKSKKEYILDKDGQREKLKNGIFKSRKISTVDWNDKEKAEVWRKAWADVTNHYLADQNRPERIDHCSYERQGKEGENPSINPIQSNQSLTLLDYLNRTIQESNTQQSNYGRSRDLKVYAKAVSFLQERRIETLAQFQEVVTEIKKNYRDMNGRIKRTERQPHERKGLVDQSGKYLKYRPIYVKYK